MRERSPSFFLSIYFLTAYCLTIYCCFTAVCHCQQETSLNESFAAVESVLLRFFVELRKATNFKQTRPKTTFGILFFRVKSVRKATLHSTGPAHRLQDLHCKT